MNEVSPRALGRSLIASAIAFGLILVSAGGAVGVVRAPAQRNLKTVPMSSWKGPRYVAGQVLVRFRHGEQPSSAAAVGARAIRALTVKGWTLVTLRGNESVDHAIARFRARADVGDVTANHVYHSLAVPNDTYFTLQWGLQNTGQSILGTAGTPGADISAPAAWDITTGSSSVIIAVADSGVDGLHPDLKPNLTTGINFVSNPPSTNTSDACGHGTHVAGIIGASGNDGYGVTGVAQHVKLMPIRVLFPSSGECVGDTSTIAEGFTYAATHGARAVNASLGGPDPDPVLQQAITSHPGTLFVVAAGNNHTDNDTTPDYPCNYTTANLICVAASDQNDQLASFSNFGAHTVHLAAPGYHIGSTVPTSSAGFGGSGFALSDSPNGPYANNADTWAEASQTIDPNGSTSCNLTYRLHLDLAPNDSLTVETSPDTLPRVWSPVQTFSDPGGVSTAGQYPLETVAPVSVDGSKFHLRFHLTSDGTGTDDGTYVDDVQVKCGTNAPIFGPDHFSSTLTGWTTGGSPQPLWGIATVAGDWAFMSGTSMATPFVTGTAALLWAKYPSASVTAVKDAILRSADDLPAFASTTFSGGRLNAQHALQMIDGTPPAGVGFTGTGIASAYQLASSFGLGWTATDSGTGVKSFDVRFERAPYNGGFGPWTTWRSGVTSSGGTFGSAPGYSYCFEVRARDNVLNTSAWSAPRCTNFPVNDTQLKASGGWSRVKSATRYLGDDTYSATNGATLTLANADWRRMDLVVSVCKGCGSVAVYSGATYLGTFSTNAPSFGTRRLVLVRSSGHVNGPATITIRIVSPSGHAVMIEGLGLFRY